MFMTVVMLFAWQSTQDAKYQAVFNKTLEAYYQGSEYKQYANRAVENVKNRIPTVINGGTVAYAIVVKKNVSLTTKRFSIIPGTSTTYTFNEVTKDGSIGITWGF